MKKLLPILSIPLLLSACTSLPENPASAAFGEDLRFLEAHTDVIVLAGAAGQAQIAVVPQYQGRVMTSTARGLAGDSYGWVNRRLIALKHVQPHMNAYGGEDRFWMGPEGGQFAIFFAPDAPFDLAHWQTPPVIDTASYELVTRTQTRALFRKHAVLSNRAGAEFDVRIERAVRLLNPFTIEELLETPVPAGLDVVAFESDNRITNTGGSRWSRDAGLLSIWILGMFRPSPDTTIVIPFVPGPVEALGPIVNDAYFGKVPGDRLIVRDDALFFRGDGLERGKIGLSPQRAKPIAGSYNASQQLLTLVQYTKPADATDYVNSMWELQDHPYGGDVLNSYNDGPPPGGGPQLGPFYELESSSPAQALNPGQSLAHTHRTFHFQGPEALLNEIALRTLGQSIATIKSAFATESPADVAAENR